MFLNQSLYSPGCLHCGSFLVEPSLFCRYCYTHFVAPRISATEWRIENIRHVFLFEWKKRDEVFLSQLVYRLKSAQSPQAIKFYASLLADKLIELNRINSFAAFVPIPGSTNSRIHSDLLAEELSQQTGIVTVRVLERVNEAAQQKTLTSRERRLTNPFRVKPEANEEFTLKFFKESPVIFVDDVLTTGQSIKHAETLICPGKPNAVATLFYRPPL